MPQTSAHLIALLCLIQRGVFLDVEQKPNNFTAQVLEIVDCFIKEVDAPWQFSDEEAVNITYLDKNRTCDKNSWRIFHCNVPLMDYVRKADILKNKSHVEEMEFYSKELFKTNSVKHYERATELQMQATQVLKQLILQIEDIKKEAADRDEHRILADNCSLVLLDLDTLRKESDKTAMEYKALQDRMEIMSFRTYTLRYYFLPFVVVVFTCGMLWNGVLLLIFVRHPETCKGPNAMLVNLALSDSLFLIVNIAIDYCRMVWGFPFGTGACYVYNFVLSLFTAASVYSMMALSLSRYIAVKATPGSSSNRLLSSMPVVLSAVWVVSALAAVPDALTSTLVQFAPNTADCSADNVMSNIICDFLFISFLPLAAITYFYVTASRRLRASVRNMPGQSLGQEKVKMARERGAKILPGLIFVFAITFVPFYTFWVIVIAFGIDIEGSLMSHTLYFVVYFLFNLNSTLNPIALYLTSGMFRKYINRYLTVGLATKQHSTESSGESNTISSKL